MGRELRRKQAKKEGKSLEKEKIVEKNQIRKFIIITCSLLITISIIYLVTALFITKELDWFDKKEETTTTENDNVSNSILASAVFKQSESEYYVYFYDFNEENSQITDTINSKLSNNKVYKVDTSSAMNSKYVGEKSNKDAKSLDELKVVAPTLIKISNETIIEYHEGKEIIDNL